MQSQINKFNFGFYCINFANFAKLQTARWK